MHAISHSSSVSNGGLAEIAQAMNWSNEAASGSGEHKLLNQAGLSDPGDLEAAVELENGYCFA